jgi:hypothetical protein
MTSVQQKKTNEFMSDFLCLKIRDFRIQSVVGKDSVELEKYLEKKNSLFLRRYKHFNFAQYITACYLTLLFSTIIYTINNNKH